MARNITRFGLRRGGSFVLCGAVRTPRPTNAIKVGRSWRAQLGLLTAPRTFYGLSLFLFLFSSLAAQETLDTNLWRVVPSFSLNSLPSNSDIRPDKFLAFDLDHSRLEALLNDSPKEMKVLANPSTTIITLPMPDGKLQRFRFVESSVMAPELASQFPEIKTYVGQGIDDPTATVRFDSIPSGFHAQILSPDGAVYIDPCIRGNTNLY